MNRQRQTVIEALQEIICCPQHDESKIAQFFDSGYLQKVDGKSIDYSGFVKHMAILKSHTRQIRLLIKAIVAEGDTVFTQHCVTAENSQGRWSEFEVFARFTLSDGKIYRCEELTRMIHGVSEDKDLGSRN